MFPVLALVIGAYLRNIDTKRLSWLVLPVVPLAIAGAYAAWIAPAGRNDEYSRLLYTEMSFWVAGAALSIAAATLIAFVLFRMQRKWLGVLLVSLGTMIGMELIERGYERISPLQSGFAVSESVRKHLTPETRLYSVGNYEQSLPFYLKRTITLVDYVDEFQMGMKIEPEKWIPSRSDFAIAWNAPGPAIAIIPPRDIDKIRSLGIEFDVIHADPRRAAIKKK